MRLLLKTWLMPPAVNVLLLVLGLCLIRRHYRTGLVLSLFGVVSLWLLSSVYISSQLALSIERYPALDPSAMPVAPVPQVIVVLGTAHHDLAAEYGVSTPTGTGLVRLHYAANLHHRTQLPLMLTGGPANARREVHAEVQAQSLRDQFKIDATWLERKSATTWQNARYSAELLHPLGIRNIVLVTHSYHMRRAVQLFELAGFNVIAAPTQLATAYPWWDWRFWLPVSDGLKLSSSVLHEYLGLLWYYFVSPLDSAMENSRESYYR